MSIVRHPVTGFLVGALAAGATVASAHEARQSNRLTEESFYADLSQGLAGIAGIADPAERQRQLLELRAAAKLGYQQVFRKRLTAELERAERDRMVLAHASNEAKRDALAREQAEQAERRAADLAQRDAEEARRRNEAQTIRLRSTLDERICRDAACTTWIYW